MAFQYNERAITTDVRSTSSVIFCIDKRKRASERICKVMNKRGVNKRKDENNPQVHIADVTGNATGASYNGFIEL